MGSHAISSRYRLQYSFHQLGSYQANHERNHRKYQAYL